jgi:hypothetical protein
VPSAVVDRYARRLIPVGWRFDIFRETVAAFTNQVVSLDGGMYPP